MSNHNYNEIPIIIKPNFYKDERGYFIETWNKSNNIWPNNDWVQDNESCSSKGVMRGFHWQMPPYEQAKLVRVIKGSVIDYAVDIRKNSPTYGKIWSVELTEENKYQFYIPRGFAHAFISLEDNTIFSYKCDNYYSKDHENSFNIDYIVEKNTVILSDKDNKAKRFNELTDNDLL